MTRPLELPHAGEDVAHARARRGPSRRGVVGWFSHVDHKSIGRRYLVTAFVFFLLGGAARRADAPAAGAPGQHA